MRTWWSILVDRGTRYGYDINPSKSVLLVKPQHLALATELFATTGVNIRTDGYRHLGAALGSALFCDGYVSQKVDTWCTELQTLAKHAASQPQAAYAVLTHGLRHKWSFLARTMPAIADLLTPLENSISQVFLPALTGRQAPGEEERAILALPCRHGGLGILNPGTLSQQYDTSSAVTRPLVEQLLRQEESIEEVVAATKAAKAAQRTANRQDQAMALSSLRDTLSDDHRRTLD